MRLLKVAEPVTQPATAHSDDYVMALMAAGQESALAEILRRYEPRVRRFCELLLKDRAAAHDATQEIFFRLWERRDRYRPNGRLRELLFTMARNQCRSAMRGKWIKALMPIDDAPSAWAAPAPSLEATLDRTERELLVVKALEGLPEKFRVPLALRFLEEMPYEEIAEIIGRTPSAARSRIHYGLQHLADALPDEVVFP